MKPTSLAVSRQLAQCFADHGVEVPESSFSWYRTVISSKWKIWLREGLSEEQKNAYDKYLAYTLCELLVELPAYIEIKETKLYKPWKVGDKFYLVIAKGHGSMGDNTLCMQYARGYCCPDQKKTGGDKILKLPVHPANGISFQTETYTFANRFEKDATPADAAAQLLIWCIENKHYGRTGS